MKVYDMEEVKIVSNASDWPFKVECPKCSKECPSISNETSYECNEFVCFCGYEFGVI